MDKKFRLNWDAQEGLPETPKNEILDWRLFNENMYSVEPKDDLIKEIMEQNQGEYIDLRPYMIVHPFTIAPHDDLDRANELFRHHHLRHLPVVNPGNGQLVGIVTRKDLFKYMAL